MRVRIDFSIYALSGVAFGDIDGWLEFAVEPLIGDTVSLMSAPNGEVMPKGHVLGGQLKVTERIVRPMQVDAAITLMLDDLVVESIPQAVEIAAYLESGFGLSSDVYEECGG